MHTCDVLWPVQCLNWCTCTDLSQGFPSAPSPLVQHLLWLGPSTRPTRWSLEAVVEQGQVTSIHWLNSTLSPTLPFLSFSLILLNPVCFQQISFFCFHNQTSHRALPRSSPAGCLSICGSRRDAAPPIHASRSLRSHLLRLNSSVIDTELAQQPCYGINMLW